MIPLVIFILLVTNLFHPFLFFSNITIDDTHTLKKSIVNLEIAKTISLCIKSDYKRRNALMKNKNAKEQIKQVNLDIMLFSNTHNFKWKKAGR